MEDIKDFRLGEKNTSTLVWNKNQNRWLCGDNTNSIISVTKDIDSQLCKNQILLENNDDDMNVNAIAVNPLHNSNQCVIAHGEKIASYIFDEENKLKLDSLLYKSFLPFTHIQYDHEGVLLFVASKASDLVIFNVDQKQLVRKIGTNEIGIRTFSVSPDSKYTAIVNMNGSVYINYLEYGYNSDLKRTIKSTDSISHHSSIINIEVTREPANSGCKLAWYPNVEKKRLLAIPSDQGSIIFLSPQEDNNNDTANAIVSNWNETFLMSINNFSHESHTLNIVAFTESGDYLVSSDMTGKIIVWAFDIETPNNSISLNSLIIGSNSGYLQDLVWDCFTTMHNSYNVLALYQNTLITFHNVVPSLTPKISNEVTITNSVTNTYQDNIQVEKGDDDDDIYADDDDNFDEIEKTNQNDGTQMNPQTQITQFSQIMQTNSTQPAIQQQQQQQQQQKQPLVTEVQVVKETIDNPSANDSSTMKRLSKKSTDHKNDDDNDDDINFINEDNTTGSNHLNNHNDTINVHEIKRTSNPIRLLQVRDDIDADDDNDNPYANEDDNDFEDDGVVINDIDGILPPQSLMGINPMNGQLTTMLQRTMQAPFQPSSTKYDDKDRRYLVWNSIGSIILRRENLDNRIEFRFTNTGGSNRNETIIDRIGYVMGSLSYEGAVFASEPEDYDEQQHLFDSDFKKNTFGSIIYYHAFPGQRQLQGVNESFQYTLPAGEAALAVAVGLGWIAIATSRNLLYIYSSVGHLCFTASIPGVVVTMTGFNYHLGIIYQSHSLQADIYEITWDKGCCVKQLAANIPLPLPSPKQIHDYEINQKKTIPYNEQSLILDWVGFDVDNLLLTILDSQGMCWSLVKVAGWKWLPVFDTFTIRKDINYLCWPVMVKQDKLVYVQLNGESMPSIHPQPVVYAKPLKIPFPTMKDSKELGESEKDQIAIKLWNQAVSTHCESELVDLTSTTTGCFPEDQSRILEEKIAKLQAQADKSVLEALQIACQKQLIPLALSLAMQLRTDKCLRAGIKLANAFGRTAVANLLANILAEKEEIAAHFEQMQYMNNNLQPAVEYHSNPNNDADHYDGIASTNEYYSDKQHNSNISKVPSVLNQALKSKSIVSPVVNLDHLNKPPRNPFLKTPSNNTNNSDNIVGKRKNVYDGIQDMKASPSPKKMPSLNRQTSFSQQARMQQLSSKHIL